MANISHRTAFRTATSSFVPLIVIAALGVAVVWGGLKFWNTGSEKSNQVDAIMHEVNRADFVLSVTERGEIKSAGVTEIRSEVKSKNTPGVAILRIIPEGSTVKKGDFVVELDSSALDSERTTQQISCNSVEALVIESLNVYQTALISKREYLEGTYVEERQTIESEVFVAEENLNRAREYYEYSKKLATKGYVNELQLEADKFAVEKSHKELEAAKTKLRVLDEFTKAKTLKQLDSDILIAEAKLAANRKSAELEQTKLKDIEDQIAKCTIVSPGNGIVMYAHERDRHGNNNFIVEEGATIRERQAILEIPDSDLMQVEIRINESLIQFVKQGMPVTILPVGMGDLELQGTVKSVNRYPEPSGWRKANVKEYKAFVEVIDPPPGIRSGLTASVTIECAFVADALKVPVQAVYAHGDQFYCMVHSHGAWQAKPVTCGPTNDKFYVIEGGLKEKDRVALNPRRFLSEVQLPTLAPEQQQRVIPPEKRVAKERAENDSEKTTLSTSQPSQPQATSAGG